MCQPRIPREPHEPNEPREPHEPNEPREPKEPNLPNETNLTEGEAMSKIAIFTFDHPGNLLGTDASKGKERLWRICFETF